VARFEKDAVADAAFGSPLPNVPTEAKIPQAAAEGKAGKGLALETAVSYNARHNIPSGQGMISFDLKCGAATSGTVFAVAPVTLRIDRGQLVLQQEKERPAEAALKLPADAAWHRFTLAWKGLDLKVSCDGQEVFAVKLTAPLGAKPSRGLQIRDNLGRANNNPPFTLGPARGAVIDNLVIAPLT
jgi:hypothetical protein